MRLRPPPLFSHFLYYTHNSRYFSPYSGDSWRVCGLLSGAETEKIRDHQILTTRLCVVFLTTRRLNASMVEFGNFRWAFQATGVVLPSYRAMPGDCVVF